MVEHLPSSDPDKRAFIKVNGDKVKLRKVDKKYKSIDHTGGVLMLANDSIKVEVPREALDSKKDLTVSLFVAESTVSVTNPAMGFNAAVAQVSFIELPHDIRFNKEVTITQQLSFHEMTCGIDTQYLFYYSAESSDFPKAVDYKYMGATDLSNPICYKNEEVGKEISIGIEEEEVNVAQAVEEGSEENKGKRHYRIIRSKTFCKICLLAITSKYSNTAMVFGQPDFDSGTREVFLEAVLTCQCKEAIDGITKDRKGRGFLPARSDWTLFTQNSELKDQYLLIGLQPGQEEQWNLQEKMFFTGNDFVSIYESSRSDRQCNRTSMAVRRDKRREASVQLRGRVFHKHSEPVPNSFIFYLKGHPTRDDSSKNAQQGGNVVCNSEYVCLRKLIDKAKRLIISVFAF